MHARAMALIDWMGWHWIRSWDVITPLSIVDFFPSCFRAICFLDRSADGMGSIVFKLQLDSIFLSLVFLSFEEREAGRRCRRRYRRRCRRMGRERGKTCRS